MATTGFWPVKGSLKDVIDYAENPDKTTEQKYLDDDLYRALSYTQNDEKTDKKMYVSTINCPKHDPYGAMMATKKQFGKLGGNVAYHGFQSFNPGEVTPEEAHKIGMETAKRMWGDDYQIVVTTHLNTDSLHNHFVINSVSFKTGRKFENHVSDHYKLREISDAICRERNKSVLENTSFYGGEKGAYWAHRDGKQTHRDMLRKDIEYCLSLSFDKQDFERRLTTLGYAFSREMNTGEPSVKAPTWKRAVRLSSVGYPKERINKAFYENRFKDEVYFQRREQPIYRKRQTPLYDLERTMYRAPWMGALAFPFFLMLELLEISIVKQEYGRAPVYPLSPELRAEIRKMDEYAEDIKLLAQHQIGTAQELFAFQENIETQIIQLVDEREHIRNRIRRAPEDEKTQLKEEAKAITKKIEPLRKQLHSARRIEERSAKIAGLLALERQAEQEAMEHNRRIERRYER